MKKKEKHKKNKETEEKKVDKKITYCHVYQCGFEKARQYLCVDGFWKKKRKKKKNKQIVCFVEVCG